MFSSGPASQVVLFDQLDIHHHPTQKKTNKKKTQEETLWDWLYCMSYHILKFLYYVYDSDDGSIFTTIEWMSAGYLWNVTLWARVQGSMLANLKGPTSRSLFERQSHWSPRSHGIVEWISKSSSMELENADHPQYFSLLLRSRGIRIRKLPCYKTATHSPEFT